MTKNNTLRFVYTHEAEPVFRDKVLEFHEQLVDELVMFGTCKNNEFINNISMSRMQYTLVDCARITAGMLNNQPIIHVVCLNKDKTKHAECAMFYISTPEVEDWFMIQIIYDFPKPKKSMVQVWKLKLVLPSQMNIFWRSR